MDFDGNDLETDFAFFASLPFDLDLEFELFSSNAEAPLDLETDPLTPLLSLPLELDFSLIPPFDWLLGCFLLEDSERSLLFEGKARGSVGACVWMVYAPSLSSSSKSTDIAVFFLDTLLLPLLEEDPDWLFLDVFLSFRRRCGLFNDDSCSWSVLVAKKVVELDDVGDTAMATAEQRDRAMNCFVLIIVMGIAKLVLCEKLVFVC